MEVHGRRPHRRRHPFCGIWRGPRQYRDEGRRQRRPAGNSRCRSGTRGDSMRAQARILVLASLVIPVPSAAQGLFKKSDPLEITITTGLGALIHDRDSTERVKHGAELAYKDTAGTVVRVAITLRTRGHFRRQTRNCDFPPLKVEMAKPAARNTLFQGTHTLKLATGCRPSHGEYEQYILQEYALYRMYQALTPWSYRTRLAHVTYQDSCLLYTSDAADDLLCVDLG